MPVSKKPRKTMGKKLFRPITSVWKQKESEYIRMAYAPYQFLNNIAEGSGKESEALDLLVRVAWGQEALNVYFKDNEEHVAEMAKAKDCAVSIVERYETTKVVSCTEEEKTFIHRGLVIADEVHKNCTRKQNLRAIELAAQNTKILPLFSKGENHGNK